jgi:oligopeptide transport system substrate-binding protein
MQATFFRGVSVLLWGASLGCCINSLGSVANAAVVPKGVALHAKQELVRNNGAEPDSLDPALAEGVPANNVLRNLFEGLTATDNHGAIVPGVATKWQQTNPTTWLFTLRTNARWSNGDKVTAEDFVYGVRRFMDPKTASKYASTYAVFLLNGKDVVNGKMPPSALGISAKDAYTLEIKTPFPVAFLPDVVSNVQMGPTHRATVEKFGPNWTKPANIVGNGAYTLGPANLTCPGCDTRAAKDANKPLPAGEWLVNNKIVLHKSNPYWDAANVQLTTLTFLTAEDGNADVKLYESGENDWVAQLPPGSYDKYKAQYPQEIHNTPILGLRYYSLLNTDPLLKDVRVRKALSMVLDREVLAQKVTADGQLPAYGLIVKGTNGASVTQYEWANWPMAQKVAEARKLLTEAGVKPNTKIKFAYNTDIYHKKMAIFAASEWKTKLGIDLEFEAMEFKVLIKRRNDGQYQIARNGWLADYNDATSFLTLVQCNSDQNSQKNCNPAAEALIDQGNQSLDPARRSDLLTQAARLVMEDYPIIPLLQYTVPRLVKPYVGGYSDTNSMDRYRGKDLYIIKH